MKKTLYGFAMAAVLVASGCAMDLGGATEDLRNARSCGGFAGTPCPDGFRCVDDPRDSCDPDRGGADCIGVCRREPGPPPRCDYGDPSRTWISRDADQCAAIRFLCEDGTTPFFDDCGCGCEDASGCASIGLCVDGYHWDDTTCSCVRDPGGEACGSATCGAGMVCCNASCGICTEPGGFCTQQVCY